jgi:hypothetical protein
MLWVALRSTGVEPSYDFRGGRSIRGGEAFTGLAAISSTSCLCRSPCAVIDGFVAEHVERPFHKRERDRADPEALAPHGPMQKERK